VNAMHIDRVWRAVPAQLAQSQDGSAHKFRFKGVIPGTSRFDRLSSALDWLEAAGLVIKIPITKSGKLPFSAYAKENVFKLLSFDVGILGALSGLSPKVILDYDYGSYKGYFAENYVAQEFLYSGKKLFSWEEGNAEIEFLIEKDGAVIPIEVKSGGVTKAKSLHSFCKKYDPPYQVILSAKNLYLDQARRTHYYPLYLASKF
jgi:predicted AAA+ superfamily ATPase